MCNLQTTVKSTYYERHRASGLPWRRPLLYIFLFASTSIGRRCTWSLVFTTSRGHTKVAAIAPASVDKTGQNIQEGGLDVNSRFTRPPLNIFHLSLPSLVYFNPFLPCKILVISSNNGSDAFNAIEYLKRAILRQTENYLALRLRQKRPLLPRSLNIQKFRFLSARNLSNSGSLLLNDLRFKKANPK
jgi:hypothetical protein